MEAATFLQGALEPMLGDRVLFDPAAVLEGGGLHPGTPQARTRSSSRHVAAASASTAPEGFLQETAIDPPEPAGASFRSKASDRGDGAWAETEAARNKRLKRMC